MRPTSWGLAIMEAAMEHFVGLDVSLKLTAICIVDGTGKIVREGGWTELNKMGRVRSVATLPVHGDLIDRDGAT